MSETQATITSWALATFGPDISIASIVARANAEMSELLFCVSAGGDARDIAYEAADVVIPLCRLAERAGFDLRQAGRDAIRGCGFLLIDLGLGQAADVERLAGTANQYMAKLFVAAAAHEDADLLERETGRVVAMLEQIVTVGGGDLWFVVDRKMAINRGRKWKREGASWSYHKKVGNA